MTERWDSHRSPKYLIEKIRKADGTEIPRDEPLFVLRAQDPLAAPVVREYARLKEPLVAEREHREIIALAAEMEEFAVKQTVPGIVPHGEPVRIVDLLTDRNVPWWVRETAEMICDVEALHAAEFLEEIALHADDVDRLFALKDGAPMWAYSLIVVMFRTGITQAGPWVKKLAAAAEERVGSRPVAAAGGR